MAEDQDTIQRCPHDSENPYTMVSTALIRDASISPECRWLLIYLLSNAPGWKIKINQVAAHVKGHIGRDRVRDLFNEACDAGYMKKEHGFGNYKYFISEKPKFKKCLQSPENQGTENQGTENQGLLSNNKGKEESKKEVSILSEVQAPSDDSSPQVQKKAKEVALQLFERVKQVYPKAKPPNLAKWEQTLDILNRRDKHSWDEIRDMIRWVFDEDHFWYKQIRSVDALKSHWDQMATQRSSYSNKSIVAKKNRQIALEIKQHLKKTGREKLLWIGSDFVTHTATNDSINLDLPTETFEPILCKWFGMVKV